MSKFFIGQRVRIVGKWDGFGPSPHGQEATITDGPGAFLGSTGNVYTWRASTATDPTIVGNSEDFEPASDSNDKVEWSECLWCPEHLRGTV